MHFPGTATLLLTSVATQATAQSNSWEISTWLSDNCSGIFTGSHVIPAIPPLDDCTITEEVCFELDESDSFHARRLRDGEGTSVYTYAHSRAACTGDFVGVATGSDRCWRRSQLGSPQSLRFVVSRCGMRFG
ncbi:hypothetical protein BDW62DRAFT_206074 [Aspergillus aurantiobrunneus]